MKEDVEFFASSYKSLIRSGMDRQEITKAVTMMLFRAVEVLSEDDYETLAREIEAEAIKAEVAEDAFRFSANQLADHNVETIGDLPVDVREEVVQRVQIAEALGARGLKVVTESDGSVDVMVEIPDRDEISISIGDLQGAVLDTMRERRPPFDNPDRDDAGLPQPCEVCGRRDERNDDSYAKANPESRAWEVGYKVKRCHAKCLPNRQA